MRLLCIDPGPVKSGWVSMFTDGVVIEFGHDENEQILEEHIDPGIGKPPPDHLVLEQVGHYGKGMVVGKTVFETCMWIGDFRRAMMPLPWTLCLRPHVKLSMCGIVSPKQASVRRAVLDKYAPSGGGKTPEIGTKKQQGPLYGMTGSHVFDALALGWHWIGTHMESVI